MPEVFTMKCDACDSVWQSQSEATLEVHQQVCQGVWPPTVDTLSVGDRIQWVFSVYEVTEISEDLCDVEGRHVELTLTDEGKTRLEVGDTKILHERRINKWLRNETSTFHPLPDGMEVLD